MSNNQLTVDINHLKAWLNGELISFTNGVGFVVQEAECIAAQEALDNGKEVVLRNGSALTGTKLKVIDGVYTEVKYE